MPTRDERAEIPDDQAETAPRRPLRGIGADAAARSKATRLDGGKQSRDFTIRDIYETQIASMHGVPVAPSEHGRVGCLWTIDERFGEGLYWYFPLDDIMSIAVFDLRFNQEVSFTCETPDLFCFGSYGRNMVPYFGITDSPVDRTLLGYAWKGQPYGQVTKADEQLDVTSILLLPKGLQQISLACHCDPLVLSRAIASLDGMREVPGLNLVFDEIRRARPSAITARAYYEAKIVEATVLLLDWFLEREHGAGQPSIRPADHSALNLARAHLRDHLDRPVPTDELCRIACMSPSKLARLFKQAEGVTPQEYARRLRMERACQLLEESDLGMAEIAEHLGFARQGSFSEAFKDRFGVTPHAFRTMRRKRRQE